MFWQTKNLIGIDISTQAVKICQLFQMKTGVYKVAALGIESLPADTFIKGELVDFSVLSDAIEKVFKDQQVKSKEVAISFSMHQQYGSNHP